jgi:hypothetical protein
VFSNSFGVCQHFFQLSSFLIQPYISLKNSIPEIDLSNQTIKNLIMKKSFKTILGILLFVVIGTSVYSQDVFSVQSKIELNGSSEPSDMKIEVTIDKCHFDINVRCVITEGELKIEIYDEKGKKQGSFSTGGLAENKIVKSEPNLKKETVKKVNGVVVKENASVGTWIVRVIPSNATGEFALDYRQMSKNEN